MGLMTNVRRTFDVMNSFRSSIASWTSAALPSTASTRAQARRSYCYTAIPPGVSSIGNHSCSERDFRCVALDYPGYGLSGAPAGYGFTPGEHTLVFGRSANKPGVPDNNARSTISSYVCRERTSSYVAPDVMKL